MNDKTKKSSVKNWDKSFITGTWEMIEAWDIGDNPDFPEMKTYPWGDPSSGYWVYDSSGHFSMILSQNPALPIPRNPLTGEPSPNWLTPLDPWKVPHKLLMETFHEAQPYAYFGTYTVELNTETGAGTINQVVTADVLRAYTGTLQPRPFVLETVKGVDYINVGEKGVYLRKLRRLT